MSTEKTSFAMIFVIWAAGLGAAAQFAKVAVVFDTVAKAYPQAEYALGFALSLVGLVGFALGVVAGLLVSQVRSKQLLCGSLAAAAMLSLYQASLPPLPLLLLSRVLEGISHLAIVVAAPTLIAQLSAERHRGFCMTLWGTFFSIAFALTAYLGLPLVNKYGLASLFIAHALYMAFVASVLWLTMPDVARDDSPKDKLLPRYLLKEHVSIYRSPHIAAAAMGWLFYASTFVALLTVLPKLLPADERLFAASAMPIASIAVSLTLGVQLLRRFPAFRVVQLGFTLAIVLLIVIWITQPSALLCVALMGVLGLVQGASFASVPQLNPGPDAQARANGAMAQMGNLGNILGPPSMLVIVNNWESTGLLLFTACLYALGIASHQWMAQRRRSQPQEEAANTSAKS